MITNYSRQAFELTTRRIADHAALLDYDVDSVSRAQIIAQHDCWITEQYMLMLAAHNEALQERLDRMTMEELLVESRETSRSRTLGYYLTEQGVLSLEDEHAEALAFNALFNAIGPANWHHTLTSTKLISFVLDYLDQFAALSAPRVNMVKSYSYNYSIGNGEPTGVKPYGLAALRNNNCNTLHTVLCIAASNR